MSVIFYTSALIYRIMSESGPFWAISVFHLLYVRACVWFCVTQKQTKKLWATPTMWHLSNTQSKFRTVRIFGDIVFISGISAIYILINAGDMRQRSIHTYRSAIFYDCVIAQAQWNPCEWALEILTPISTCTIRIKIKRKLRSNRHFLTEN